VNRAAKYVNEFEDARNFSDVEAESQRILSFVQGYENKLLVSLQEAVNPRFIRSRTQTNGFNSEKSSLEKLDHVASAPS
jgi:hypothetical protein